MKTAIGKDVNGFLTKLEKHYSLVSKKQPLFAKETSKDCHYQIDDCFFRFWFRFVHRNRGLMELERFERMLEIAERDFNVFGGYALERYFYWKFVEDSSYTAMGSWWNRKGENEIDLVCFDEAAGRLDFYEVKHNPERIKIGVLERKVEAFLASNPKLRDKTIRCLPLSLKDM